MPRFVSLAEFMPYGAPDLLASGPRNLSRALVASSALATAAFILATWMPFAGQRSAPLPPIVLCCPEERHELLPPPPVDLPEKWEARSSGEPDQAGWVQPVDDVVAPEATFEMPGPSSTDEGSDTGPAETIAPASGGGGAGDDPLPDRHVDQYVEVLPEAVIVVKPEYPSMARDLGIEGLVIVHTLVGKNGRVIKVEADEHHSVPLLDGAAMEAARRWVFTPALANGKAVPAWVALKFQFTIH